MQRIHADNLRNESEIDFVVVDHSEYASLDDFYSEVVRVLWDGWDSIENTEKYIVAARKSVRTIDELQNVVAECLATTPVPDFIPNLKGLENILSFRDDWNLKEFVWCRGNECWYMGWGTSA